jgi:isopenicillin-N epimerase
MTARTKVLFLSHITSPTALVFPIENVVKEARKRGVITIIDGAHAPGLIDLDLKDVDADYYSGNCHKWMMAPKGSAFLWARRDVQHILEPTVVSHGWVQQNGDPDQLGIFGNSRFIDGFEVQGTRDPAAWLTVPSAIEFKKSNDWDEVCKRSAELAMATALAISERTNLPLLAAPEFLTPQMISVPLPDCDVAEIYQRLLKDFNIEIPVFRWSDKCLVRLSVQGYNTQQDADSLVAAISEVCEL